MRAHHHDIGFQRGAVDFLGFIAHAHKYLRAHFGRYALDDERGQLLPRLLLYDLSQRRDRSDAMHQSQRRQYMKRQQFGALVARHVDSRAQGYARRLTQISRAQDSFDSRHR
jgi:hypothetical protein